MASIIVSMGGRVHEIEREQVMGGGGYRAPLARAQC